MLSCVCCALEAPACTVYVRMNVESHLGLEFSVWGGVTTNVYVYVCVL